MQFKADAIMHTNLQENVLAITTHAIASVIQKHVMHAKVSLLELHEELIKGHQVQVHDRH